MQTTAVAHDNRSTNEDPHKTGDKTVLLLKANNGNIEVKADIEADIMKGILERVPEGEPDTWCSRLVIQERKMGRLDEWLTFLTSVKMDWTSLTTREVRP